MASSVRKMLECPVCFEKMCLPKLLPCGHTFCIVCLRKMADTKRREIECPNCRKIHNLPKDGVNGFNNNYTLLELISLNVNSLVQSPSPPTTTHYGRFFLKWGFLIFPKNIGLKQLRILPK